MIKLYPYNLFKLRTLVENGKLKVENLIVNFNYIIKKKSTVRIILSVLAAHAVGSLLVKTFGIYAYYNMSYWMLLLYRIPTYAVIIAVESFFLCLIFRHKAFTKYTR